MIASSIVVTPGWFPNAPGQPGASVKISVPSAQLARYGLIRIVHLVAARPTRTLFSIALRCAPWVVATHLNRQGRFIAAFHLAGCCPAMGLT
jgi:hypothetical protein